MRFSDTLSSGSRGSRDASSCDPRDEGSDESREAVAANNSSLGDGSGGRELAEDVVATKVVYIVPELTPPAVRLVLSQRTTWEEWNAEEHGPDEVSSGGNVK